MEKNKLPLITIEEAKELLSLPLEESETPAGRMELIYQLATLPEGDDNGWEI